MKPLSHSLSSLYFSSNSNIDFKSASLKVYFSCKLNTQSMFSKLRLQQQEQQQQVCLGQSENSLYSCSWY